MIKKIFNKILRHEVNSKKYSSTKKEFYDFVDSYASNYDFLSDNQ